MAENKMKLTNKDIAVLILVFVGGFMLLGSAGNVECRDEMKNENQRLGYEKYDVDAEISPTATKAACCGGIATLALAAALGFKKER